MLEFNATFIVAIFSFVVFIMIMNTIFYKPILGIIDERKKYINDLYLDAKNSNDMAQKVLSEKEERLSETLFKAKQIVSDKVNFANIDAKNKIEQAKSESDLKVKSAKEELLNAEAKCLNELKQNEDDLSNIIAAKILDLDEAVK